MSNELAIASIFNPARDSDYNHQYKIDGSRFSRIWVGTYFFFQGEANVDKRNLNLFGLAMTRPYIVAALEIANTMDRKKTTNCEDIKTYIGALDYANPLIPLSLLCITAARNMHIKCLKLKDEGSMHSYRALKLAQVVFNIAVNIPLFVVTGLAIFAWDLVKALVSVVAATLAACVLTPLSYAIAPDNQRNQL